MPTFRAVVARLLPWCCAGAALAAPAAPTAEPYPWDKRPASCFGPSRPDTKACQPHDWPDYETTLDRVRNLRNTGRYQLLERALAELGASSDVFKEGHSKLDAVWWTLADFHLDKRFPAQVYEQRLAQWQAAVPGSPFARLAAVMIQRDAALTGAASPLPSERDRSQAALQQAGKELLELPPDVRATAIWHLVAIDVVTELDPPAGSLPTLLEAAMDRWPRELAFYSRTLDQLHPDRGGNWAAVEKFIVEATRRTSRTEGQSFYTRLYLELEDDLALGKTLSVWSNMDRGFQDWIARHPSLQLKNVYASHACRARDRRAYVKAMESLKMDEIVPPFWVRGHGPEACARWASR